jgi:hypothetical protein
MYRPWWGLCLLIPLLASGAPGRTPAERWWGVVVGVGEYEHLDSSLALEGPRNDVPLVLTWLSREHIPRQHLTVLADHVAGADGLPTRAAIMDALDRLSARSQPGDIAFLYFAGHGSQEPLPGGTGTKADGFEELFLPRDVGHWNGSTGRVAGAIAGSDIGRAVDALRERGIFVWLVFDSCHSATMARGLASTVGERLRAISLERLGGPAGSSSPGRSNAPASPPLKLTARSLPGGYVAFYAAQTVGVAPEMPLPRGEPDRKVHGLFTYALLRSLAATNGGSYRELAHRILALYAVTYPATTPEFEGSLDGPIGAPTQPLVPVGAWPAENTGTHFHIEAGRLNGVTPGSLLSLTPPLSPVNTTYSIGLLRVSRATLTDAWADTVSAPEELRRWHVPADRTAEVGSGLVTLLDSRLDLTVRVVGPVTCLQLPPQSCAQRGRASTDLASLEAARALINRPGELPGSVRLTDDIDTADLLLAVADRHLFILRSRRAVSLEDAASIALDAPDAAGRLRDALLRATRAIGLIRLGGEFPGRVDGLLESLRMREPSGAWRSVSQSARLPLGAELAIRLQNPGPSDLDVTVLSIDERFGITPVFPLDRETNRLGSASRPVEVPVWAAAGRYELLFITDESRAGSPHDLSYLAQPGVTRAARGSDFATLLERLGFASDARRSAASATGGAASIRVMEYEVVDQH